MRRGLFVLGGALAGLIYQRVVGCGTGTCVITSSPYVATLYGALVGFLASGGVTRPRSARGAPEAPALGPSTLAPRDPR